MTALFGLARRNWLISNPSEVPKSAKPLRFGILSAADITPSALIVPAKTHPEVLVQVVASRDPNRAKAFAQKHGIPEVATTYQDILDNPNIDCVYIPLPNSLHLKWALRALEAGKHVLLEKPSVGNAAEARALFRSPHLASAGPHRTPPVILEAAHFLFHPAWTAFMSCVSPADVVSARAVLWVPRWRLAADDIRYGYELAGGALMDLGFYTATALMRVFGAVAEKCVECDTEPGLLDARCDRAFRARYRFPGGGERFGEMEGDLKAPLDRLSPDVHVVHRPVIVSDGLDADISAEVERAGGRDKVEVFRTRKVKFTTFVQPAYMHSVEVDDEYEMRRVRTAPAVVLRTWKRSRTSKAYTFRDAGVEQPGESYWATYRYQLEQFVNRVRGRETKQWFDGEDSINTLRMIDMAYAAARLPLRMSEMDKKKVERKS
ncbi:oxidoreductase domain-containing protein [Biscogniauxia marginata]|nr:oxidoreductase domain-containing protein [Biscogniauxia marginata]